ncbi:MAG: hypothetical protein AAB214_03855 [Fibrobacterota bacterium]
MNIPRILLPCILLAPLGFAQVVLENYTVGGAGGTIVLGTASDSTQMVVGIGGSHGGLVELDATIVAKLGFPISVNESGGQTGILLGSSSTKNSIRASYDGSALVLDFQAIEAIDATVRVVDIDGSMVAPIQSYRLAPGNSRKSYSVTGLQGKTLFLLTDVGAQRKVWKFHTVAP